jgi:glycine/D-amino acid oxidase-like deaminating enzyme
LTARKGWDAVVVGGGLVGSAIAYHLAVEGVPTLLVEQGDLASGASGANFGLVQVQDAEFGLSLELTLESFSRFPTLEAQLDWDLDYHRAGYLLLIENEKQFSAMKRREAHLHSMGLPVELLSGEDVCRLEPHVSPESVIGALYHPNEGVLNPFELVYAYARRGQDHGLDVWTHTCVRGLETGNGLGLVLDTTGGTLAADWVVLATGAWTRRLARTIGLDIPVEWVHGEAMITEPVPSIVRRAMTSAVFFQETEGAEGQTVGFCLHQRPRGHVMLGEAARVTDRLDRQVTVSSLPAVAAEAQRRLPVLRQASVIRGWGIPVAFAADHRPFLGPVDEVDGLLIAAGFKSTIVLTPLVGELVAGMVMGKLVEPRLTEFFPSRSRGQASGRAM